MDCRAYCNADSYRIKPFFEQVRHHYKATIFKDALHLEVPLERGNTGDVFYFSYGAIVAWAIPKEKELELIKIIRPFADKMLKEMESDEFTFIYGENPRIVEDEIVLPNHESLYKLAISHALAQSVKLGTFESAIYATYTESQYIPENLAKRGDIPLSRNAIRKKMGELFLARNSINLHADVLDTPEFFWEYPELEPLYMTAANYLDVETRVEVLNQRLDVIHELFQMLGSELNHQHSSRLEWTIICLIVIEVVLTLMRDFF